MFSEFGYKGNHYFLISKHFSNKFLFMSKIYRKKNLQHNKCHVTGITKGGGGR